MPESARVTIQAMTGITVGTTQHVGPRLEGPIMKWWTFNCEAEDKYSKLNNFRLKVNNMFKYYSRPQAEQITIDKNWLGRRGLQFSETLTKTEQEKK